MSWGMGINSTTKFSVEFRHILLGKAVHFFNNLNALQQRALRHASPQDVIVVAALIPLPPQTPKEEEDLKDSATRLDFPWLTNLTHCSDVQA